VSILCTKSLENELSNTIDENFKTFISLEKAFLIFNLNCFVESIGNFLITIGFKTPKLELNKMERRIQSFFKTSKANQ
jgi:hypothetical protein